MSHQEDTSVCFWSVEYFHSVPSRFQKYCKSLAGGAMRYFSFPWISLLLFWSICRDL